MGEAVVFKLREGLYLTTATYADYYMRLSVTFDDILSYVTTDLTSLKLICGTFFDVRLLLAYYGGRLFATFLAGGNFIFMRFTASLRGGCFCPGQGYATTGVLSW